MVIYIIAQTTDDPTDMSRQQESIVTTAQKPPGPTTKVGSLLVLYCTIYFVI